MPTITVLTPVHEGGHAYLHELYECLRGQKLPAGWRLEWIVQEDGRTGEPLRAVPDPPWISKGTGRRGGAAQARTLGLARATGTLLRCVDADDLLPAEETLAHDIEVLEARPAYGWTVAPCLDLHPDGRLEPGPYDPAPGPLPRRALLDGAGRGAFPVVGTTMTARTDLVRLVGGWPALPAFEDAALLLCCAAVSRGWMQSEPGLLYRKHPRQHTASAAFHDAEETRLRQQIAITRARALTATGWHWTPPA
ncbi:glycosyltransferase [Streptomyces sp. A012304]|uniref:glycosyltransferase family 2 protein n=1 Tax=Streptomyces sp. A012304 TaxID=375446 RepID=UPI00222E2A75|nr:glycosyltransferase [Streptomyces sp. A012304]GKQ38930.1 glycosyl transferase [Streptomyces sp. A012304]